MSTDQETITLQVELKTGSWIRQSVLVPVPAETKLQDLRASVEAWVGQHIAQVDMFATVAGGFLGDQRD